MRNPKWHRDEIILALNLYFRKDRGSIDPKNEKVVELSQLLNQLPLFTDRPDAERFRNPNGVSLKLSNFLAIDPDYTGTGMKSVSKLDKEVFAEYANQREKLQHIAAEIREAVENPSLLRDFSSIEEDEQSRTDAVQEGQILYKLHKFRERDPSLVTRKKEMVFAQTKRLACEACSFEFSVMYGSIGDGFIECHHRTPLASMKVKSVTTLDDLALVCSNCHRMLHRKIDTMTVEHLRTLISYDQLRFAEDKDFQS